MKRAGRITLDPIRFRAEFEGTTSEELTSVEYRILSLFQKNHFQPILKEQMLQEIWRGCQIERKTINVHLSHLRRKLAPMGFTVTHMHKSAFAIVTSASETLNSVI